MQTELMLCQLKVFEEVGYRFADIKRFKLETVNCFTSVYERNYAQTRFRPRET